MRPSFRPKKGIRWREIRRRLGLLTRQSPQSEEGQAELWFLWHSYATAPDSTLAPSGIALKRAIRSTIHPAVAA